MEDDVPLFKVTPVELLKFVNVAPLQSKVASFAPVKVILTPDAFTSAPAAPAVALKLIVPLLVKLPPTERACVVTVEVPPDAADLKLAPALTVTSLLVVKVCAVVPYCSTPELPPPIVSVPTEGLPALASIVMVAPLAMVTLSPILGTTPPTQEAAELQLPVTAFEDIFAGGADVNEILSTEAGGAVPPPPSFCQVKISLTELPASDAGKIIVWFI